MTSTRLLLLTVAVAAVNACAGAPSQLAVPSPEEIPGLESVVASDPGDVDAGLQLAAGYREAGRLSDARALINRLLEVVPDDPGLLAMSGLLAEDSGDLGAARAAYRQVLDGGRAGSLGVEIERHLEAVRREELRLEVVSALEREGSVAQMTPDAATVGVFPFFYEGGDPEWEPLAYALPEMLSTDLAITGRLQVVDRVRIYTVLNELALGESGRVEEATAARSGRLLGSGNIVQARFRIDDGVRIGIDAALVEVSAPGLGPVDQLSLEDAIERLFDMEKQLALDLHAELGVQLTPAERERINEKQTESVQALLEFGRGVAAENRGDYAEAQEHFSSAASIDPGFSLAATRSARTARLAGRGTPDTPRRFSDAARRLASQRRAVDLLRNVPPDKRSSVLQSLGMQKRAVLAEVLGQDRVGQVILLELIFRLPGG